MLTKTKMVWKNITVEPLAFLTTLIMALSGIAANDLYLQKACQVNLNYSAEVCGNLTLDVHNETQEETQKYVSSVQAYNGLLQNLPPLVFVLFAGPLSDTYGRKPLIVISLAGFFILNLVFMINSIFFMELKVEYILFECLQDLTGGNPIFNLALTSYIADVSSNESRTARLCFVSAVTSFGFMVGGPLGTRIRALFGYVPLFGFNLGLATIAILYSIFALKDSMEVVSEERREEMEMEKFKAEIKCDRFVGQKLLQAVLSNFFTLAKKRPNRRHVYIFLVIIGLVTFSGTEEGPVVFMFYKRQYKIDSETFAWLGSAWGLCSFFSQLLLVPFLSFTLGIRDTTILILAFASNSASLLLEVAMSEEWALFFSWTALQLLWSNMDKAAISAISKIVGPQEIGKILCLVQLSKALLTVAGSPFYASLYRFALDINFPGLCRCVSVLTFACGGALATYSRFTMIVTSEEESDRGDKKSSRE